MAGPQEALPRTAGQVRRHIVVKKSSIFARLKERWRSGSGMKVEPMRRGGDEVKAPVNRMPGNGSRELQAGGAADLRSSRKLSEREEASVALSQHFQDIGALLRGVQSRMDKNHDRLDNVADSLGKLPAVNQQQLQMLQQLASHVERQNTIGENLARTLTGLPDLLQNVEQALQRAANTDERTASTVREFQVTMDRIQNQMGKMVEHSAESAAATRSLAEKREQSWTELATNLTEGQQRAVAELQRSNTEGLTSLRRTHEDQSNRLHKVVEEHAGWNRAVLAVLGIVLLGMVAILVVLLAR
jgi:hypothetical protein